MPTTVAAQHQPPRPLPSLPSEDICFLHPGYAGYNLLLTLPRVDRTTISTYGVYHRTALLACQIIAGNVFNNSYFTLDKAGQQRAQVLLDGILTDNEYYFIVEGLDLYPIVPSFRDWEFPHNRIPDWWHPVSTSSISPWECGITNSGYAIDEAHLVPNEEKTWYQENQMARYGTGGLPNIDNSANILPLRKDIHFTFDDQWFVIVPKIVTIDSSLQPSRQYVTHIISRSAAELWPTYHNTLVGSLRFDSRAYLFARFAWAVIFRTKLFVIAGQPRQVIQISRNPAGNVEGYKTKFSTGKELEQAYGGGGSKAATPVTKKRKSENGSTENDEDIFADSSGDDMEDTDFWDVMNGWETRGENRRQESSEETAPDIIPLHTSSEETAPGTKIQLEPALEVELRAALHQVIPQQDVA